MGRTPETFAMIEHEFCLNDARFLCLSAKAQLVYLKIWVKAVKDRTEYLDNRRGTLERQLAAYCNLTEKEVKNCLAEITEYSPFLTLLGDWYKVNGVKTKHHGWQWISQNIPEIVPLNSPN